MVELIRMPLLSLYWMQYKVVVLLTSSVTGRPVGRAKSCQCPAATSATLPVSAGDNARHRYPGAQAAGVDWADAADTPTAVMAPAARTGGAGAPAEARRHRASRARRPAGG